MILNFDATQIEPDNNFELIPDGTEAIAVISATETKETRGGTGSYLKLKIEIIDGDYKGRVLFDNLNLQNKNETAMKIAYQTLAKICTAINKPQIQTSEELCDIPLKIKIGVRKQEGYEPTNIIKNYTSANDESVAPAKKPTQQSNSAVPPWKRG